MGVKFAVCETNKSDVFNTNMTTKEQIWLPSEIFSNYSCVITQMHMCVKFEASMTNISGVIHINVNKKSQYSCKIMNTWAFVDTINMHVHSTQIHMHFKFEDSITNI